MKLYSFYVLNFVCIFIIFSNALPTTLLENTKSLNLHANKVKRTPDGNLLRNAHLEESNVDSSYFNKPSAKKRGGISTQNFDLDLPTWEPESQSFERQQQDVDLRKLNPELYSNLEVPLEEKSMNEYEKGFHYGANKDKLDEQMENAILKSELYGDPTSLNQYRYYGQDNRRKRNSVSVPNLKQLNNRFKREIIGNPEDDLFDLISLWEAQRKYNNHNKQNWQQKSYNPQDFDAGDEELIDDGDIEESDENWLETPVYPNSHNVGHFAYPQRVFNAEPSPYYYETKDYNQQPAPNYVKRQWLGFGDRNKRFMVSRKRSDPTRELRYFTGANVNHNQNRDNNIYTLAQLLSGSQREPNVPLYHRAVL